MASGLGNKLDVGIKYRDIYGQKGSLSLFPIKSEMYKILRIIDGQKIQFSLEK